MPCDKILREWTHQRTKWACYDHVTVPKLLASASSCRLCNLIVSCPYSPSTIDPDDLRDIPFHMRDDLSETDPVKFLFDRITSDGCVPYIKIRIPTKSNGPLWTNIAAWADHGTILHDMLCSELNYYSDSCGTIQSCVYDAAIDK